MKTLPTIWLTVLVSCVASGIEYSSPSVNITIPDMGESSSEIEIDDNYIISEITLTLTIYHENIGDLEIVLVTPDEELLLMRQKGVNVIDMIDLTYDDNATRDAESDISFKNVRIRPEEALSALRGRKSRGTYRIKVYDAAKHNVGSIGQWTLNMNYYPVIRAMDFRANADKDFVANLIPMDFDCGSFDPDGDMVTIETIPEGPYAIGITDVEFIATDTDGNTSSQMVKATVETTAYCLIKSAINRLEGNVPNQTIEALENCLEADWLTWANGNRISHAQGGYNGAVIFTYQRQAISEMDLNNEIVSTAIADIIRADKILVDTLIDDVRFQNNVDLEEEKRLRNAGCVAFNNGDFMGAIDNYMHAFKEAQKKSYEIGDINKDGRTDMDDMRILLGIQCIRCSY